MPTSDEFTGDLSLWTEVDPAAVGAFTTASGQLQLLHNAGTDTDLWTDRKNAPRLVQPVTTPLDISAKLAAVPGEDGAYGLIVNNADRTNVLRLDYFTDGGTTNLFFAHIVAGAFEIGHNATVAGNPLFLRIVMPDSSSAEALHSADGVTWTSLTTLDLTIEGAMAAAEAGPYGSTAFTPFPQQTYLWDYVRFDLAPGGGGAVPAEGSAAAGLGLALAAAGFRPSQGTAALSLGLALAGTGMTAQVDSAAGQATAGLGLRLAVTGARSSAGTAALTLGLGLAASTVIVAPTPAERTTVVPADPRVVVVPAESRTLTIPEEDRRVVVPA